jgi:AcrR family transcriptional regulator
MRNADRREQSVDAIMIGALALLERVGFSRLRVADVAEASEVSVGTLFRYFPTKNDLIRGALQRGLAEHVWRLEQGLREHSPAPVTRRFAFELLCDTSLHPRMRWTYELYAAVSHEPELGEFVHDVVNDHGARLEQVLSEVIATAGPLVGDDTTRLIDLVSWCMQGLAINDLARDGKGQRDKLVDLLLMLTERTYGPEAIRNVSSRSPQL